MAILKKSVAGRFYWLLISIVCLLAAALLAGFANYHIHSLLAANTLYIVGCVAILYFFERDSRQAQLHDWQALMQRSLYVGGAISGVALLHNYLKTEILAPSIKSGGEVMVFNWPYTFEGITAAASFAFFAHTLIVFRRLIYQKRSSAIVQRWNLILLIMAIIAVASLQILPIPIFVNIVLLITGVITGAFLGVRINWIVLLNYNEKLKMGGIMVLLILMAGVILNEWIVLNCPAFILNPPEQNNFQVFVMAAVVFYAVFATLGLGFNLPLASAIEAQRQEIRSFQEISGAINRESIEQIITRIFKLCCNQHPDNAGWLLWPSHKQLYLRHEIDLIDAQVLTLRCQIETWLEKADKPYFYERNLEKAKLNTGLNNPYNSLLVLPLFTTEGTFIAAICLVQTYANAFDLPAINGLVSYIEQGRIAYQNTHLLQQSAANERLRQEVKIATQIQQALLPRNFPDSNWFEMAAYARSASEVGGDYYDFYQPTPQQLAVVIGDVSGKGISAAFYMAQLKGIFQSISPTVQNPTQFLQQANVAVSACLGRNSFITLTYILFDAEANKAIWTRAGHCPTAFFRMKTAASYLPGEGVGLGIIRNTSYNNFIDTQQQTLQPNDVFVLYTDGLIEGRNPQTNELWGYENLKNCLSKNAHLNSADIKNAIVEAFIEFTQKTPTDFLDDDTTLVVIKIKAN
ncbi:MAG: PP2C family protein-serine/threonine phosphatase [Sphingobacteriales bacterium]|jgi:sigma-B regulation protein RsbU (phosphoserine phosphatase)|nr:PP2C family protein-serine/threonine phosphatase [Sphingobacteriales bacterium]MBP9141477.1 PP2C family protein-serine/threonine phosphatase [Chitinophagales bacterium]MDA0198063.1 PP2C family protein-serine/threonine phosphatase [Bacteroidota bacterium]MBK7527031.1 PP2C family protein-serine/threonine phosphatase [Sphingobacteriales bacterium]MBK8677521.1 PP2C family protein-serine/threonine phosphatase [Sphingobacteriales bacterium]